jgi:type VI secretion system protein ImpI
MRPAEPPPLAPVSPPPPKPQPRRPTPKAETPEAPPFADEPSASSAPNSDALPLIAGAAGLSPTIFDGRSADEVAAEIGALMRITAERLAAMLHARDETRSQMRSASRSLQHGQAFSPLEFGDPREALGMMFGPHSPRYLDARAAVEKAFSDLEMHHMLVFAAMRATLERLFADLAPERIEASIASDRGLGALLASRKAQLWDIYVERWRALSRRSDGRLSEAFWALIGEAYDRLNERGG